MWRTEVRRIEPAGGIEAGDGDLESASTWQRRVVTERALGRRVGAEGEVAVESGRSGARSSRHIENRAEFQSVLRGIRTLDEVDKGQVVQIDLAADIPVELLRQGHAIQHVVDDAVVAIHMD